MQTTMEDVESGEQNELYTLLGIERTATSEEIRKAYRAKALRWHPDKVDASLKEEAEEMFKSIKQAYDVLSDENKRKLYDRYGAASLEPNFEPPVVAPQPSFPFSFPMPPPGTQPQPAPQPSVFHDFPDMWPPFMHRSSSFDPFFGPAPHPVPDIFETYFGYPPQAYPFMYSSQPTPGPAPAPQFSQGYQHPFAFPFPMFTVPPFPQPEPHPIPPMPPSQPTFVYMSPPTTSPFMQYQSPVTTPPRPETVPEEEYFRPNERHEPQRHDFHRYEPRRWGPMQPQPPEPKLPKMPRKGRNGFVHKLRRRESSTASQPRRAWDEQDVRHRRGDSPPTRAERLRDFLSYFTRR